MYSMIASLITKWFYLLKYYVTLLIYTILDLNQRPSVSTQLTVILAYLNSLQTGGYVLGVNIVCIVYIISKYLQILNILCITLMKIKYSSVCNIIEMGITAWNDHSNRCSTWKLISHIGLFQGSCRIYCEYSRHISWTTNISIVFRII
jgi:hypothetical protein